MKNNPIGILDSGIGGVTVLKEILKILPNENYIYYSDSIHNPYGDKNKEKVLSYVDEIMQFFIDKKCKVVVFACNTATALTVAEMRNKYSNLIIIGIEPAYKMIHDYANNKKTLVMATPATIQSEKFLNLYHEYDNKKTNLLPCPNLASLIEKGNKEKITEYLKNILMDFTDIEAVVLGCTHYPLIKNEIKKILGDIQFFDGGVGVAHRLNSLLLKNKLLNDSKNGSIIFYDSSKECYKEKRFYELLK